MNNPIDAKRPMRELIRQYPMLLMVLRRFAISLGFGNASVADVCHKAGVHTDTFLAVANFVSGCQWAQCQIDLDALVTYLKNSHDYFMNFALPAIRRRLIDSVHISDTDGVGLLLLKYFDNYVKEVEAHMGYENTHLFPYIEALTHGSDTDNFDIGNFARSHSPLAPRLEELKEIFVSHYQGGGDEDMLNAALYDIITCENDLTSHCDMEDCLLIPAVERLKASAPQTAAPDQAEPSPAKPELTQREKEIVRCIARGLSTKEIADKLFVSVHTINTHRRNICAKLDIHSASALAIYAIIHKLVDISEIDQGARL